MEQKKTESKFNAFLGKVKEKMLIKIPNLYFWIAVGGLSAVMLIVQIILLSKA